MADERLSAECEECGAAMPVRFMEQPRDDDGDGTEDVQVDVCVVCRPPVAGYDPNESYYDSAAEESERDISGLSQRELHGPASVSPLADKAE